MATAFSHLKATGFEALLYVPELRVETIRYIAVAWRQDAGDIANLAPVMNNGFPA
jgi:hypothetical protein